MKLPVIASTLCACLGLAQAAQANTGQINSFGASATSVLEGTLVDFTVDFGISTDGWNSGGSDLNEPAPAEGNQYRNLNWYTAYSETVTLVWLSAEGASFTDYPSVPNSSHNDGTDHNSIDRAFGSQTITIQVAAVPEPQSLALLLAGVAVVGRRRA